MSADSPPLASILLASAATGVVLHQFFKNFEVDRFPLSILGSVVASHWAVAYGLQSTSERYASFWASQRLAFCVVSCAVLSLWANMLVYRAFFHPLNKFPGPFGAKLTKFWSLKKVHESDTKWFRVAGELHEQYGDYVRTGPRELTVLDTAALAPMLGNRMVKGPFYGALEKSIHTNRDNEFHRKRRKVWDMAFKQSQYLPESSRLSNHLLNITHPSALEDYGPSIEEFTDTLLTRIDSTVGTPEVINQLAIHYSYDVMSALAFGTSTHFTEGKSTAMATAILNSITEGVVAVGFFMHVSWFLTIVETLSAFGGPMKMWKVWCDEQVATRREMKNSRPDIMGYLLEHTEDTPEGRRLLNAESRVIISAGRYVRARANPAPPTDQAQRHHHHRALHDLPPARTPPRVPAEAARRGGALLRRRLLYVRAPAEPPRRRHQRDHAPLPAHPLRHAAHGAQGRHPHRRRRDPGRHSPLLRALPLPPRYATSPCPP